MNPAALARWKLAGLFMVFLGPLALAFVLYYGFDYGGQKTNAGVLLSPAKRLPGDLALRDRGQSITLSGRVLETKWTLLQVAPEGCGRACRASLKKTRQVRALLHDDVGRVQRVLLMGDEPPPAAADRQPDLAIYRTNLHPLTRMIDAAGAGAPGTVYLVDPLGNWMLYYPAHSDGGGLFKDLKHLLALSHIG